MSLTVSRLAANAQLDALAKLIDGGFLRIYSGARPASPDVLTTKDHQLLAEMRFGSPAFFRADDGVINARVIAPEESAKFEGDAGWYRAFAADGVTPIVDGSVGMKDADLLVNTPHVAKTAIFSVQGFRLKVPG